MTGTAYTNLQRALVLPVVNTEARNRFLAVVFQRRLEESIVRTTKGGAFRAARCFFHPASEVPRKAGGLTKFNQEYVAGMSSYH